MNKISVISRVASPRLTALTPRRKEELVLKKYWKQEQHLETIHSFHSTTLFVCAVSLFVRLYV